MTLAASTFGLTKFLATLESMLVLGYGMSQFIPLGMGIYPMSKLIN